METFQRVALAWMLVSIGACGGGGSGGSTVPAPSPAPAPAPAPATAPSAPAGLSAVTASSSSIQLSWTASAGGTHPIANYQVERCQGSSCNNFTQIATVGNASHNDTGLLAATPYRYRVRAADAQGVLSGYSAVATATTASAALPTGSKVTSFQLTAPTAGLVPFTTGLAFAKGQVTGVPALAIADQQVVVMRRWNDGSVKHAIASGHLLLTASAAATVDVLNAASASGGTSLTASSIQAANPQATVSLGTYGSVGLSTLLANPLRTFVAGPEMVEAHYGSKVGSDATLHVYFHVRLYKSGRIWVRTSVENGYLDVATSSKTYAPVVTLNGTVAYNNGGAMLTHHAHTRWSAEGWLGSDPQVTPRLNTVDLMATKLVPNYWKRNPSSAALDALYQTYVPYQSGGWTPTMGDTGYQPQIGLLPLWDALYLTSGGDARAYRSLVANAKALNSYALIWRDSLTGLATLPSQRTNWNFNGPESGGGNPPGGGAGLSWDGAHHGSGGYLAYMVTGDYYHLETLQHQASLCYLQQSTAYGGGYGVQRHILSQTRNVAWCNRSIGQLAAIAPANDTVADDYRALLVNNTAYWLSVANTAGMNPLTYLYFYEMGAMTSYFANGGIPPWQYDFWTQTYGFLSDAEPLSAQDMTTLNALRDVQYRQVVARLGAGGAASFCFANAGRFAISISANNSSDPSTWFTSWAQVEAATNGATACGNTLLGTSGSDPGQSAGYWGNMLPAIAYAVDHGAPGAAAAWSRLTGATNWSAFSNSGFDDTPVWGVYPRTLGP